MRSSSRNHHYRILDGLRGVASLTVLVFHLFEAYSDGDAQRQIINHGYLAVDFFFLLSGFVIAHAYDERWARGLTAWQFFKRRWVRLEPMVVAGSVLGALLFAFQKFSLFPGVETATVWKVIGVMLIGFTMVPLPKSADIRGWNENYPLNGPAWSLFYEYVANALYAVGVRRLPNRALAVLCALFGAATVHLAVFGHRGDFIGGWTLDAEGIHIGLTRVLFPFFAGVLLSRSGWRLRTPLGFVLCSLLLLVALALPRFDGLEKPWVNGLYESFCVIVLFPIIVALGAGADEGVAEDDRSLRVAQFFGALSYPLYITHYPLIYIYTGWVVDNRVPPAQGALVGTGVVVAAILIAWACLKWWDEPARRWLTRRIG